MGFLWLLAIGGAVVGELMVAITVFTAESAPQQAAGFAMALAFAAVPYVLARSVEKMRRATLAECQACFERIDARAKVCPYCCTTFAAAAAAPAQLETTRARAEPAPPNPAFGKGDVLTIVYALGAVLLLIVAMVVLSR